jgi:rhodanese-related sulfurtransferase
VESGEGILYDTRSVEEYQALHAAGAVSFPEADMAARYAELPTDSALVFY